MVKQQTPIDPMLHELAEAPTRFEVLVPPEELIECDDCVVYFAPGSGARSCAVQRVRFDPASFQSTIERVRALLNARGRSEATWEIVTPTHARSTIDRLRSFGMRPSVPPYAIVMTLSSEPPPPNPNVVVTSVETIEEFKAHVSITHQVFGMLDRLQDELTRIETDGERKLADRTFIRYLARVDGVPVGAATATFTIAGAMLHSGSTLAEHRGRGVYSSMVAHRWGEAVARGTPHLITRAGPMSRNILEKLGFLELGEVHFLVDSIQ